MRRQKPLIKLKPLQYGSVVLQPPTVLLLIIFILLIGILLVNLAFASAMGA